VRAVSATGTVLQPRQFTMKEPSRSYHGEGRFDLLAIRTLPLSSPPGYGSGTVRTLGSGQERPVCAASSAKTVGIIAVVKPTERSGSPRGRSTADSVSNAQGRAPYFRSHRQWR